VPPHQFIEDKAALMGGFISLCRKSTPTPKSQTRFVGRDVHITPKKHETSANCGVMAHCARHTRSTERDIAP